MFRHKKYTKVTSIESEGLSALLDTDFMSLLQRVIQEEHLRIRGHDFGDGSTVRLGLAPYPHDMCQELSDVRSYTHVVTGLFDLQGIPDSHDTSLFVLMVEGNNRGGYSSFAVLTDLISFQNVVEVRKGSTYGITDRILLTNPDIIGTPPTPFASFIYEYVEVVCTYFDHPYLEWN